MSESKRQTDWSSNFEQVKTFSSSNSRWPSTTSKDPVEKALGQWWSRQKYLLNKKNDDGTSGLPSERESEIRNLLESNIRFERDGIWDSYYQMTVSKIKADSKLWSYSTTNAEEQKNIRWWNQQKTFARKFKSGQAGSFGGMTQERFDKIEALMRIMGESIESKTVAVADSTVES